MYTRVYLLLHFSFRLIFELIRSTVHSLTRCVEVNRSCINGGGGRGGLLASIIIILNFITIGSHYKLECVSQD